MTLYLHKYIPSFPNNIHTQTVREQPQRKHDDDVSKIRHDGGASIFSHTATITPQYALSHGRGGVEPD